MDNSSAKMKIHYAPHRGAAYGQAEIDAVVETLKSGWLAGNGPKSAEFETKIAEKFNKKFGIFTNSGSSSVLLGLASLKLPPNSEIITASCTFSTTVAPIVQLGLTPVFCDIAGNGRFVPTTEQVIEKITPRTRVILLPNLIGDMPDWTELHERLIAMGVRDKIILFEDSADTIPRPETKSPSDISICSFYSSHTITTCGSGGSCMFNSEALARKARGIRDWGRVGSDNEEMSARFDGSTIDGIPYDVKFLYNELGYNFKSSEVNAAFGLVQLGRLDEIVAHRSAIFARYMERLAPLAAQNLLILPARHNQNWMALALVMGDADTQSRTDLLTYLENNQVQTRVCFAGNITRHPAYRQYLVDMPESDRVMADGFLLGCHHGMSLADCDRVCDLIFAFFRGSASPEPHAHPNEERKGD